jgi:HD-GYP domain-containing protein (c-di-GMP phosphodiesterase class II)
MFLMAAALGLKDRYTRDHAHRVGLYAQRLAGRLGLGADQIQLISLGGMLHDVGKLALSDQIFSNRNADLSNEMFSEVQSHPLIGGAILGRLDCDGAIRDAALYHHERIDGSGYPFGLKGEEIPLSARIVSIVDCFDAITTERPYQKSKSCSEAIQALKDMAGVRLSADLVTLFIDEICHGGMVD